VDKNKKGKKIKQHFDERQLSGGEKESRRRSKGGGQSRQIEGQKKRKRIGKRGKLKMKYHPLTDQGPKKQEHNHARRPEESGAHHKNR